MQRWGSREEWLLVEWLFRRWMSWNFQYLSDFVHWIRIWPLKCSKGTQLFTAAFLKQAPNGLFQSCSAACSVSIMITLLTVLDFSKAFTSVKAFSTCRSKSTWFCWLRYLIRLYIEFHASNFHLKRDSVVGKSAGEQSSRMRFRTRPSASNKRHFGQSSSTQTRLHFCGQTTNILFKNFSLYERILPFFFDTLIIYFRINLSNIRFGYIMLRTWKIPYQDLGSYGDISICHRFES